MAESLLSYDFDMVFEVLLLLPTETLLRVQMVCRTWAQVISDPAFVCAHCSRHSQATGIFTQSDCIGTQVQNLTPFQKGAKFPTAISNIQSSGYEAESGSHGVLCFRQDNVFIVGNPATSYWSVVRHASPSLGFSMYVESSYVYHGVALIYDPAISLNFKLAVAMSKFDYNELTYHIKFHIYSSETCSWTKSSVFTQPWNPPVGNFEGGVWNIVPCKIRGGLVCRRYGFDFLVGYEIATDTFCKIPLPPSFYLAYAIDISGYDGTIHCTIISRKAAKVWRLETKDSWVLEGEGGSDELHSVFPFWFGYDISRRAVLIEDRKKKLLALHLSSSKLETFTELEFPVDYPQVAHGNTLATLGGVERGTDNLAREFRRMGLRPLNLSANYKLVDQDDMEACDLFLKLVFGIIRFFGSVLKFNFDVIMFLFIMHVILL